MIPMKTILRIVGFFEQSFNEKNPAWSFRYLVGVCESSHRGGQIAVRTEYTRNKQTHSSNKTTDSIVSTSG